MNLKNVLNKSTLVFCLLALISCSNNDEPLNETNRAEIPVNSKAFLEKLLPNETPESFIRLEVPETATGALYVAIYSDGLDVEFDPDGEWVVVDGGNNQPVPQAAVDLLPDEFQKELMGKYAETPINTIYKSGDKSYKVNMGGVEISFTLPSITVKAPEEAVHDTLYVE